MVDNTSYKYNTVTMTDFLDTNAKKAHAFDQLLSALCDQLISVDDNGCGILYNEDIGFAVMVDGVPHKNLSATQSVQLYLDYLNSQGS